MSRPRGMKRRKKGPPRIDASELREFVRQMLPDWVVLAKVVDPGAALKTGDVWVEVQTQPKLAPLSCRLASIGGGYAARYRYSEGLPIPEEPRSVGIWAPPQVGAEGLVAIPGGDYHGDCVWLCTLSTMKRPADLDTYAMALIAVNGMILRTIGLGPIRIETQAGNVELQAGQQGAVVGNVVLQGGSLDVARKTDSVSVTFPAGQYTDVSTGFPNLPLTLTGTITGGNSRVKA